MSAGASARRSRQRSPKYRAAEVFRKSVYSEHRFLERQNTAVVGFLSPRFRRVFGTGRSASRGRKFFRHSQCAKLVGLQGNFLCQHDVACDEVDIGHKTPTGTRPAGAVDLMDVHRGSVVNPISLAAITAGDVKIAFCLILGELLWRQPFSQKRQAARFGVVFAAERVAQSFRPADRYR